MQRSSSFHIERPYKIFALRLPIWLPIITHLYLYAHIIQWSNRHYLWSNEINFHFETVSIISQIVFEGVVGSSYTGDIAIDDITLTNFRCSHIPTVAAPPTLAPTTTVPSDSNCTFEKGICNWRQLRTDNFDWTRNKDNTGSWGTGPLGDHTTGKGNGV